MKTPAYTTKDIMEHALVLYGVALGWQESIEIYEQLEKFAQVGNGWANKTKDHSSCAFAIWLKSRLLELGFITWTHKPMEELSLPVTMHCFFIQIEENELHISRLRNEAVEDRDSTARSRLKRYMESQQINPINKTTLAVARPPSD